MNTYQCYLYNNLMDHWRALAERVESIQDDDERHAVCREMDETLAEINRLEAEVKAHDDGEIMRHETLSDPHLAGF